MAQLRADPPTSSPQGSSPFQTSLEVVLHNETTNVVELHPFLIRIPFLVLEVKDPNGDPVGLPPPPFPPLAEEMADWSMKELRAGDSLSLRFENFLDWDANPGKYCARFRSTHPCTGGSPENPLTSDWIRFEVNESPQTAIPLGVPPALTGTDPWTEDGEVLKRVSGIPQSPSGNCPDPWGKDFVRGYFSRAEDEPAVGSEWKARFRVDVDKEHSSVQVTVRVQVTKYPTFAHVVRSGEHGAERRAGNL